MLRWSSSRRPEGAQHSSAFLMDSSLPWMVAESQLPEVFDGWRYEANGGRDNFAKRHHGHFLIKSCPTILHMQQFLTESAWFGNAFLTLHAV